MPKKELINKIIRRMDQVFDNDFCLRRFIREIKNNYKSDKNISVNDKTIKYIDDSVEFDIDLLNKKLHFKESKENIYNQLNEDVKTREISYSERENIGNLNENVEYKVLYNYVSDEGQVINQIILNSKYNNNEVYRNNDIVFRGRSIHCDRQERDLINDKINLITFFLIKEVYYLRNDITLKIVNENGDEKYFYCYKGNEKEITYVEAKDIIESIDEYRPCKVRTL